MPCLFHLVHGLGFSGDKPRLCRKDGYFLYNAYLAFTFESSEIKVKDCREEAGTHLILEWSLWKLGSVIAFIAK